jgi:hypothetical protein
MIVQPPSEAPAAWKQLALRQATAGGMNLANSLVVLALRSAGKEMDDAVRHD